MELMTHDNIVDIIYKSEFENGSGMKDLIASGKAFHKENNSKVNFMELNLADKIYFDFECYPEFNYITKKETMTEKLKLELNNLEESKKKHSKDIDNKTKDKRKINLTIRKYQFQRFVKNFYNSLEKGFYDSMIHTAKEAKTHVSEDIVELRKKVDKIEEKSILIKNIYEMELRQAYLSMKYPIIDMSFVKDYTKEVTADIKISRKYMDDYNRVKTQTRLRKFSSKLPELAIYKRNKRKMILNLELEGTFYDNGKPLNSSNIHYEPWIVNSKLAESICYQKNSGTEGEYHITATSYFTGKIPSEAYKVMRELKKDFGTHVYILAEVKKWEITQEKIVIPTPIHDDPIIFGYNPETKTCFFGAKFDCTKLEQEIVDKYLQKPAPGRN